MPSTKVTPAPLARSLREVAIEVAADWPAVKREGELDRRFGFNVGQHPANPYWSAMRCLPTADLGASYGYDSASEVVLYFLENASQWKGETAKRVKAELKAALADHRASKASAR